MKALLSSREAGWLLKQPSFQFLRQSFLVFENCIIVMPKADQPLAEKLTEN